MKYTRHHHFVSIAGVILLWAGQAQAVANFSGHWIANEGKLTSTVGMSADCTKVEIIIEQTETQIKTRLYDAKCSLFGSKWGPVVQEIRDGKVYEEGVEVGTITEDTMITVSNSGTYQYAYNLRLKTNAQGQIILESYYGTKGSLGSMVTQALHNRAAP
ncbi:MAG: hypothetical protein AAGB31_06475 [Bdellovibrio sp.]